MCFKSKKRKIKETRKETNFPNSKKKRRFVSDNRLSGSDINQCAKYVDFLYKNLGTYIEPKNNQFRQKNFVKFEKFVREQLFEKNIGLYYRPAIAENSDVKSHVAI